MLSKVNQYWIRGWKNTQEDSNETYLINKKLGWN